MNTSHKYLVLGAVIVLTVIGLFMWFDRDTIAIDAASRAELLALNRADLVALNQDIEEIKAQLRRIEALQFQRTASTDPRTQTVTLDSTILRETLQAIVEEELNRISPAMTRAVDLQAPRQTVEGNFAPIPSQEAFGQSEYIVSDAIAAGEWTGEDTARMIPLVNSLTHEQRTELLEQFHTALNRGDIELMGAVPPL